MQMRLARMRSSSSVTVVRMTWKTSPQRFRKMLFMLMSLILDRHKPRPPRRSLLLLVLHLVLPAARKQLLHVLGDAPEALPWERRFSALEHLKEPVGQELGTLQALLACHRFAPFEDSSSWAFNRTPRREPWLAGWASSEHDAAESEPSATPQRTRSARS